MPLERTLAIGLEVARIWLAAHARGDSLGGLRPERVYVLDHTLTAIAPRGEPFLAVTQKREYGVPPCFATFYTSPEQLARGGGAATPADDTFAFAAMLATWHTGKHPFHGEYAENAMAVATGARVPWEGARALQVILDQALVRVPHRISLERLCELLRELSVRG